MDLVSTDMLYASSLVVVSSFCVKVGSGVHQEAKVISPDFPQPRVDQGMISSFPVCLCGQF